MNLTMEEELYLQTVEPRINLLNIYVEKINEAAFSHLRSLQALIDKLEARVEALEAGTSPKSTCEPPAATDGSEYTTRIGVIRGDISLESLRAKLRESGLTVL